MGDPRPSLRGFAFVLVGVAVAVAVGSWLVSGPILQWRLHGRWRSSAPLPCLILVLHEDHSYDWDTEDPSHAPSTHGRWRVVGGDLELAAPGSTLRLPYRLSTDRRMNSMLILDGRWYMPMRD